MLFRYDLDSDKAFVVVLRSDHLGATRSGSRNDVRAASFSSVVPIYMSYQYPSQ